MYIFWLTVGWFENEIKFKWRQQQKGKNTRDQRVAKSRLKINDQWHEKCDRSKHREEESVNFKLKIHSNTQTALSIYIKYALKSIRHHRCTLKTLCLHLTEKKRRSFAFMQLTESQSMDVEMYFRFSVATTNRELSFIDCMRHRKRGSDFHYLYNATTQLRFQLPNASISQKIKMHIFTEMYTEFAMFICTVCQHAKYLHISFFLYIFEFHA